MSINAKKLSFLGLLLAFAVVLVILGGIIETSTLFLLAGASFCVGIAIRESGIKMGIGFYFASIILSFLLAPNKFYCITFTAMGLYIVVSEFAFNKLTNKNQFSNRRRIFWIIKYITFNIMYIPILIFLPSLFYQGEINSGILAGVFVVGQIILFIYDMAYNYFQKSVWGKIRTKIQL